MLGLWFPKVAVIAVNCPLTGTCVTKRSGNVPATTGVGRGGGVADGTAGDGPPALVTDWFGSPPVQEAVEIESTAHPRKWIVHRESQLSPVDLVIFMIEGPLGSRMCHTTPV
jgi:hypothetical protein